VGGVGNALFACAQLGDEPLWIVLQMCTLAAMYAILASSREGGHDGTHPCVLSHYHSEHIMKGGTTKTGTLNFETITKWGLRGVLRRLLSGLHVRIPPTKQVPEFPV
jgi:hypothetical protein